MVNVLDDSGVEREHTFVAPLPTDAIAIEKTFPEASKGIGFSYGLTYLEPTPQALQLMLNVMRELGMDFMGASARDHVQGFLAGTLRINNLGMVHGPEDQGGKLRRWFFVKSDKDPTGQEVHLRTPLPPIEDAGRVVRANQILLKQVQEVAGLIRRFQRWNFPGQEGEQCTLDLRADVCGGVSPDFGLTASLKTIEVEYGPNTPGTLIEDIRMRLIDLGAFPSELRIPDLARSREEVARLVRHLLQKGHVPEEYIELRPVLV